jgi:hypothetical protein
MINDFIGVFENTLSPETCKYFIQHFEKMKSVGFSYSRTEAEMKSLSKEDESCNLMSDNSLKLLLWGRGGKNPHVNEFIDNFWKNYEIYANKYNALRQLPKHDILAIKLQKTLPTEGYHVWHFENGTLMTANRILTWMIYLNDVKEGGETEFLYQSKRISPKQGTMVLWPAAFTHLHRGNPPLSGEKYVMTSWLEYV